MKKVYLNHDANTDDFTSLFYLLQSPEVEVVGVSVIGADGYVVPGVSASKKIIEYFSNQRNITVAGSIGRPAYPFPEAWRMLSFHVDALPILNESSFEDIYQSDRPAHLHLIDVLKKSEDKVTLLFTGPLTDLAMALEVDPTIVDSIDKLYWMGGTLEADGNVIHPEHDGSAEWNAFWDPQAVQTVFDSSIEIVIVGLESTNQVPLTHELRNEWATYRKYDGMDFIGQCYAMVPPLFFKENNSTYYFWDVLTTFACTQPYLVKTKRVNVKVMLDYPSQGKTIEHSEGRPVEWVVDVDAKRFNQQMIALAQIEMTKKDSV